MNCIQSVIMPKNHSCRTTEYQSSQQTPILPSNMVIPVAIINSIPAATQNNTFHENENNRIKHCVKPMKWQDRVCLDFVCFDAKLCLTYAIRFGMC